MSNSLLTRVSLIEKDHRPEIIFDDANFGALMELAKVRTRVKSEAKIGRTKYSDIEGVEREVNTRQYKTLK